MAEKSSGTLDVVDKETKKDVYWYYPIFLVVYLSSGLSNNSVMFPICGNGGKK